MESKYIGRSYEGFEVVNCFRKNPYKKKYGKDKKPTIHAAYSYDLYNKETQQHLTLSGNQLRRIESGKRTISEMLNTKARASKNPRINAYLKWVRA